MRMGRWVLWLAMVLAWSMGAFTLGAAPKRLKVLTSFLPVYCFAANVAGDRAEVENLLPANVDPHEYQFSRRDIAKISRADLIQGRRACARCGPFHRAPRAATASSRRTPDSGT